MEYLDVQPIRKPAVLDTLLATDALSRVSGSAYNAVNGGYRNPVAAMTLPIFSTHTKAGAGMVASGGSTAGGALPDPSKRVGLQAFMAPPQINSTHFNHLVKAGGGGFGVGDLEGGADRGKKGRGGSRNVGANRKRSRTAQQAEDGGLGLAMDSGGLNITPLRSGIRQRAITAAGEKTPGRKQNGQSSRRGDKRSVLLAAASDQQQKIGGGNTNSPAPLSGVFDIYGLKTRPVDISPYVTDLSLTELVSLSSQGVATSCKAAEQARHDIEQPLDRQLGSLLSFLHPFNQPSLRSTSRKSDAEASSSMAGELATMSSRSAGKVRPQRLMFDLESRGQAGEGESVARMVETSSAQRNTETSEVHAGKDGHGTEGVASSRLQRDSSMLAQSFNVESLNLYPLEEFMGRLNLSTSEVLLDTLLSQTTCEREGGLQVAPLPAGASMNKSRSIPPQPFSLPPLGHPRSEVESKVGRTSQRGWISCGATMGSGRVQNSVCSVDLMELGVGVGSSDKDLGSNGIHNLAGAGKSQDMIADERCMADQVSVGPHDAMKPTDSAVPMQVEPRDASAAVPSEDGKLVSHPGASNQDDRLVAEGGSKIAMGIQPGLTTSSAHPFTEHHGNSLDLQAEEKAAVPPVPVSDSVLADVNVDLPSATPDSEEGHSPRAVTAAHILMAISASTEPLDMQGGVARSRRLFETYAGAPSQRPPKSLKTGHMVGGMASQDSGSGRDGLDGGNVPPNKALVSEKRKSLSQVNEASAKVIPPLPSRGNACGLRGSAAGPRVNGWCKKGSRNSSKDASVTAVSPPATGGHEGAAPANQVRSNALCSSQHKSVAAAAKSPATHRLESGKGSRPLNGATSPHSLGKVTRPPSPPPVKPLRPLSAEGKQKKKGKTAIAD